MVPWTSAGNKGDICIDLTVMLLMKNHAINQFTQLEYGVENYDTEVVDDSDKFDNIDNF